MRQRSDLVDSIGEAGPHDEMASHSDLFLVLAFRVEAKEMRTRNRSRASLSMVLSVNFALGESR